MSSPPLTPPHLWARNPDVEPLKQVIRQDRCAPHPYPPVQPIDSEQESVPTMSLSRLRQRPRRRLTLILTLLFLVSLALTTVTTGRADAASGCQFLGGSGFVDTQASFSQAVTSYDCGPTTNGGWNVDAAMSFIAGDGFRADHIRGCRAHIVLVSDDRGPLGDLDVPCTRQAQTQSAWSVRSAGGWVITRPGHYHFTGWINIQAGSPYNTFPHAARTNFTTS